MRCDFKNDIDCSALPFQTRGEKKMIYLPNVVLFVIFSWKKKMQQNSILELLRILCGKAPKSPVNTHKVLKICWGSVLPDPVEISQSVTSTRKYFLNHTIFCQKKNDSRCNLHTVLPLLLIVQMYALFALGLQSTQLSVASISEHWFPQTMK